MITRLQTSDIKRTRFTCGCGEQFIRDIPTEVISGAGRGNLALMVQSQRDEEIACVLVVSQVTTKCPSCGKKLNLMKPKFKVQNAPQAASEKFEVIMPTPDSVFYSVEDTSRLTVQ